MEKQTCRFKFGISRPPPQAPQPISSAQLLTALHQHPPSPPLHPPVKCILRNPEKIGKSVHFCLFFSHVPVMEVLWSDLDDAHKNPSDQWVHHLGPPFTPWRRALAIPQRGAKARPRPASVEGVCSLEAVDVGTRSFAPCVAG